MHAAADQRNFTHRPKTDGQWADGRRLQLNDDERVKLEDDALHCRERIESHYAKHGFASIRPDDLRKRFKAWGIYTQRKPGVDGGKTATLEPAEIEDTHFMVRVRVDGGRLNVRQARAIADVSRRFGRGTADITDRSNIQIHWVDIENIPELWHVLESAGLSTQEACGDVPRAVLGSPVAGIDAEELIDGTPAIEEIHRRVLANPQYANLPRKFKTAVSGSPFQDIPHEINDISFVGVVHPELGVGFDVWIGGGLSTNPHLAERLGAFVTLDEVPDVWEAAVRLFQEYGYRRLRARARLKFLVADWGAARVRQVLEDEFLQRRLTDGPEPPRPEPGRRDHVGVHPQRDGRFYIGIAPTVGRISANVLDRVADAAEAVGSDSIRLTTEQKLVIADVPVERVDATVADIESTGLLRVRQVSQFRRGTMACTGIEYCKLAIVETKTRATGLVDELERRLPDFAHPLTINVNGCPNSCARIQVADIGLKGVLATNEHGEQTEGYQVHLGGSLGQREGFGRTVRGLRVAAEELPDYIERVARRFEEQHDADETFAEWATRADETELV